MVGFIDDLSYSGGSVVLGGWVQSLDGRSVIVVARRSGTVIASTLAEHSRAEVRSGKSFSLVLPLGINADAILNGGLTITTDFNKSEIPVYKQLADKILQASWDHTLNEKIIPDDISYFGMAVGMTSPNGSVVVGRDGFLFLRGGSNSLKHLYKMEQPIAEKLAEEWDDLIRERHCNLTAAGMQFSQIIIPEKSTTLHKICPFESGDGTPLLRALEARLVGLNAFVNGRELLARESSISAFRKIDSHLSPLGAMIVFEACLGRLGIDLNGSFDMTGSAIGASDLSPHFHGLALYERMSIPEGPYIKELERDLRLVETHQVEQHIGTRVRYLNPKAPHKARVIAFANSFFERGHSSACISWWFARWFESFTFVWSPSVDYEMVRAERPDIVICQTIERFLPVVPKDESAAVQRFVSTGP